MSIRALARDLYQAQTKVDRLAKMVKEAPVKEIQAIQHELGQAERELQLIRGMLEGEKQSADFKSRFKGFGRTG